ncbi:MAG: Polyprenyl synthetase, partial [Acidimicrobiaceae bacterium]|nr:Polyprenyl synthetase [Acidimicrobiaceae bacterium]
KKTLPVAAALAAGGPGAEELSALLGTEQLEEEGVARAAVLVEACGGRSAAQEEADRRLASALAALEGVSLAERPCEELVEIAHFVVEREF